MNIENIKNSIKQNIIQNFMENVKHARRGPEHQRPKSWSKGTKSGSDKKKMRREGKKETRDMNEHRENCNQKILKEFSDKPNLLDLASRIPENRLQQQIYTLKSTGAYTDKAGQLPPHLVALNRISGWTHTGMDTEPTPRISGQLPKTTIASEVMYGKPKPYKQLLGLDPETIVPPAQQRTADKNEKATQAQAQAGSQQSQPAPEVQTAIRQALDAAARIRQNQSPEPMNEARKDWYSRRTSAQGMAYAAGERALENYQRGFAQNAVGSLLRQHGHDGTNLNDLGGLSRHPWWFKVGSFSSGLPGMLHVDELKTHPDFVPYMTGLRAAHQEAMGRTEHPEQQYWHKQSIKSIDQLMPTQSDLSESIYTKLKTRLDEQTPMGWHEGDPELEGDKISKIETSLSPEERDPFHLVHPETREEINKTMREPHGHILGPAGMLGRIQSIADMALDTKSYGDDPDALKRISQLIHYMHHAKRKHQQDDTGSDYRNIPT